MYHPSSNEKALIGVYFLITASSAYHILYLTETSNFWVTEFSTTMLKSLV